MCVQLAILTLTIIHLGTAIEIATVSPSCDRSSMPCVTLAQYSPSTSDNITMILIPGDHTLMSLVRFENREYVSIQGQNSARTVITCSRSISLIDFEFLRVNTISLKNLVLVHCYVTIVGARNLNSVSIYYVSFLGQDQRLTIMSCNNVSISYSNLQGRRYAREAMMEFNEIDRLEINYCNFTDIYASPRGSVISFNAIHQVLLFQCNIKDITKSAFGNVIQFQNS